MEIFEYMSKTGSGNLHDAAALANVLAKEGWRLVAVDRAGYNYVAIFERKKEKSE